MALTDTGFSMGILATQKVRHCGPGSKGGDMSWKKPARRRDPGLALEHQTRTKLRTTRWLRLHVVLIAMLTLAGLWLGGALLRWAGFEALALRYALLLPLTYLLYLGLLRLWARMLLDGDAGDAGDGALDAADMALDMADGVPIPTRTFQAGAGGDFGGGGASGDFADAAVEAGLNAGGDALGALADADEGIIVAIPLAVVIGIATLLATLLGVGVFALFGVDVLLAVAVEVALAALAGSFAYRRQREGWFGVAIGHTWRGALAMLVLGVTLGWVIDHWLPAADSLPRAIQLLLKH